MILVLIIVIGGTLYFTERSVAPVLPPSNPVVSGLSPTSGPVGTEVTITGSGFAATNTVEFGDLVAAGLVPASSDGTQIVFRVPMSLAPNCNPHEACPQFLALVTPRAYSVSVISGSTTQDIGTFTVTGVSVRLP